MRKFMIFAALGLLTLSACKQNQEKVNEDSIRLAQMEEQYQDATNFNDSLLLLMGDIYAGLDSINSQEGLLMTPGIGDNVDKRDEIRQNLSAIRLRLQHNKKLLADLEKKAKESGENNKVLQRTIEQLKTRISEQDSKIEELTQKLASANQQITDLTGQVEQKDQEIAEVTQQKESAEAQTVAVENEANKVYYVIGSNKQLKEWGMLQKKFLGATKIMQGDDINFSKFQTADKRTLTSIPTGAKKVEIKSLNDAKSYRIEGDTDGPKTIVITNPDLFWQKTSYLVIETK